MEGTGLGCWGRMSLQLCPGLALPPPATESSLIPFPSELPSPHLYNSNVASIQSPQRNAV